jgi:crotonobetainyl-CoA:carnitine CoA-transferase CaiB-like acyl-CoA transferase
LPISFLGKSLNDFGAEVYLIRPLTDNEIMGALEYLHDAKFKIGLNLKEDSHVSIFKKIINKVDILIDGYRPGVLEKLNLDPKDLLKINPKLIVIRVTGYGQEGLMHSQPGHEINYLGLSGQLDNFKKGKKFVNPLLILGDLFCGSLMPIYHISQALLHRKLTGAGCIIDSAITTNLLSLTALISKTTDNKFYFTCICKDYEYVLIHVRSPDNIHHSLRKICERLLIEVLNTNETSEDQRLSLTRDYIDFFQLITKSILDTVKYIKELTKYLTKNEIIKNLSKVRNVEVYPIMLYRDLIKFFKSSGIIDDSLEVNPPTHTELIENQNYIPQKKQIIDLYQILKKFEITDYDIQNYIQSKKDLQPKL